MPAQEQLEIISQIKDIQLNITQHLANQAELNVLVDDLLAELANLAAHQAEHHNLKTADSILSYGEQFSSNIFAEVLRSIGVNAEQFDVRQVMKN